MDLSIKPIRMNLSLWLVDGPTFGVVSDLSRTGDDRRGCLQLYNIVPSENWRSANMIGSCWIEGEARLHQHSNKPFGHLLEVVFPLEDGHLLGQILLVNPAKAP
jgi:hypothetical protein